MQVKYGTYSGNGTSKSITGVGFAPNLVITTSINGQSDSLFKTSDMAGNVSMPMRSDAGQVTNGITSLDSDGFSIGANIYANNNGSTYVYAAIKNDNSGDFTTFTYSGNGTTNHGITGFGFTPIFAVVKGDHAHTGAYRYSSAPSNSSSVFYGGTNNSGEIISLDADGVTFGTGTEANANGVTFYGFAFASVTNRTKCFAYLGTGSDNIYINTPGFPPGWVWIKAQDAVNSPGFRYTSHTGDNTSLFDGAQFSNGIQAFGTYGFQLGTNGSVNTSGKTYNCFVLYDPSSLSTVVPSIPASYTQPALPAPPSGGGWYFNCVDLQVVTKSEGWNQDSTKRGNEYTAIKNLTSNYIALAVPYDNLAKYTNYVTDARSKGFKIWHRSHWNGWQGDNSVPVGIGRTDYLENTYKFIVNNSTLFANGDMFGLCVECNNADNSSNYTFRVPETSGGSFNYAKYNQFLKDQVAYANAAFSAIGKTVYTWPISLGLSNLNLNGQTLDSGDGGNSSGLADADIVSYFGGILTIDHYMSDSYRYSDATSYWSKYSSDLDKIHTAFPSCKIMIGEWGYHTTTTVPPEEKHDMFEQIVNIWRSKSYIIGANFWVHMGSNTASVFNDAGGTIITNDWNVKDAILRSFTTGNKALGPRARV